MAETKSWWQSKTIWVNIVALLSVLLSTEWGFELTAEETTSILVIINLILRAVTKQPLGK